MSAVGVARHGPRFDSLVHVTRTGRWLNDRDDASLRRLLGELDRAAVERSCLVGLPGVVDNEYVLECAASSGERLMPIAGVDPRAPESSARGAFARELAASGFRGIKLHPRLGGYDPLDACVVETIRAAGDAGLPVFLDTLFRQRERPTQSAADTVDRLAHACPDVRIVLLHGGGPELLAVAQVVRLHRAVLLDLSYTIMAYQGSSLELDLRWVLEHLDRRVVIGSDMPEFTPAEVFARAEALGAAMPADKWANVAHDNLARMFADAHGAGPAVS